MNLGMSVRFINQLYPAAGRSALDDPTALGLRGRHFWQISLMTLLACRDLDPLEGKLENGCGPSDCDRCQQDCSAGSIDMALTAAVERVPCKHCMWLRVG
jgi:hypothetical protein